MNKIILTVAAVAIAGFLAFGVLTPEQGEQAEGVLAGFSETAQEGLDNAVDATQELAADTEAAADDAYEATADAAQDAFDSIENAIEPAAGDVEEAGEEVQDELNDAAN